MKTVLPLVFLSSFFIGNVALSQVIINEWMTKNSTGILDQDNEHSDWVELYNTGSSPINIGGFGLSDEENDPHKWIFPATTIQPNGFLLVFCSGKNQLGSELHTSFKLSASDDLLLADPIGNLVSEVEISHATPDVSDGLAVDGSLPVVEFFLSTPNSSNLNGTWHNRIGLSHPAGFHSAPFELSISSTQVQHSIHYTLDGSEPDQNDPIFPVSLLIQDRTNEPINLASIPTTAPNLLEDVLWELPAAQPFRGTVIRLRSYENGHASSHTLSATYLVHPDGKNRYSLPVVSIISDSLCLFDYDSGIYVPGLNHDQNPTAGGVWGSGNYHLSGDDWERKAHVEFFSDSGQLELSQSVGIRIHGSGSRAYPQKSLRLYARKNYGESKFEFEAFPGIEKDEFDVLVLRNFGQDFVTGVAQDVLASLLIKNLNQASLAYRAAITFVNGEYWGIQNIRERYDKHFLADLHELEKDSVDIIEGYFGGVNNGDNSAFWSLYNFMEENDLSAPTNYEFVSDRMDIDDFIDNTLTRIYLGCYDWPGNNVRMWRERSPSGKFRWLLLDNDGCLNDPDFNSLEHATYPDAPGWPNPPESTLFLRRLLANGGFRQQFISRMVELLNTEFNRLRVATYASELFSTYENSYDEHHARWLALSQGTSFEQNYHNLIDMIEVRSCYIKEHFIEYFNLNESEFLYDCVESELNLTIDDKTNNGFVVYPNPSTGLVNLTVLNELRDVTNISVIDVNGRVVENKMGSFLQNQTISFELNDLASGLYWINVISQNQSFVKKLVIQKP